jgi:phosphoglycerate dehydrogenase-like enzyme
VVYEADLLARPRYAADHTAPLQRSPEAEVRWRSLLSKADVLFDFDHTNLEALPELAPRVRWVQATSAGIGQLMKRYGYASRMPRTVFTTASGVHAQPLAEFCVLAMLAWSRGLFRMLADQRSRRWERFAGTDLDGRTLLVFGHGAIGAEVTRSARVFGMRTIGVRRSPAGKDPAHHHVDELHGPEALHELLPRAEFLVLAAPHTGETEDVIGRQELALLPRGALLVNVGRGPLVDEAALVEALDSGQLGGAVLDVFREEPLPPASPLWAMPNVLISPHSASTSDRENARLSDLFCDNLRRFLAGEPLRNVFDASRLY